MVMLSRKAMMVSASLVPTVILTSAAETTVYVAFSVTATFSETVNGFTVGDITVTNGTVSNFAGSGSVYTFDVSPTANGTVSVSVAAGVCENLQGTLNAASNTLERTAAAPMDLIASAQSGTGINLTWTDNVTGETGYKVERSLDGSSWTEIAQIATANLASYDDVGLTPETQYYYRVRAYDVSGNGVYSNTVEDTTEVVIGVNEYLLDRFDDTNGVGLDAHTMNTGAGWTEHNGTWQISGNELVQTTSTATAINYVASADVGNADMVVSATLRTQASSGMHTAGVAVRLVDATNFWLVRVIVDVVSSNIFFELHEVVNGAFTRRAEKVWVAKFQVSINITVKCSGNDITAWVDGGYSLSYTSALFNTATRAGLVETRVNTGWRAWTFENFQVIATPTYPITRYGVVVNETGDDAQEPSVLYDSNPQILTANNYIFKMWYTIGDAPSVINYAESADGEMWTQYGSNPVLSGYQHHHVLKVGATYYFYGTKKPDREQIDLYTSSDGITWSLDTAACIALGAGGTWDDAMLGNCFVWQESASDWRMLYEASDGAAWQTGYATSSDGKTWNKHASNPVMAASGPYVQKVGSIYYAWVHQVTDRDGGPLPTYITRYSSTDLLTWTLEPYSVLIPRVGADEGEDTYLGQTADPCIVEKDGTAYIFYTITDNGTLATAGVFQINLATADANVISGY